MKQNKLTVEEAVRNLVELTESVRGEHEDIYIPDGPMIKHFQGTYDDDYGGPIIKHFQE